VRAALESARRLGKITLLNPAPAASELPADWFDLIDYLIPNELEAATLSGIEITTPDDARRAAGVLRGRGARNVIVTLGSQGVFALLDSEEGRHFSAPAVKAIDTTAAGDTFIGGFAAELARGEAVADAIAFGQRAAAIAVTREGAQPSIPHRREVASV
jgi:ribokinase